jgi:hypothetical protein
LIREAANKYKIFIGYPDADFFIGNWEKVKIDSVGIGSLMANNSPNPQLWIWPKIGEMNNLKSE